MLSRFAACTECYIAIDSPVGRSVPAVGVLKGYAGEVFRRCENEEALGTLAQRYQGRRLVNLGYEELQGLPGSRFREPFRALGGLKFKFCYEGFCRLGVWSRKRLDHALERLQAGDTMQRNARTGMALKKEHVLAFLDMLRREEAYAHA